MATPLTLRVLPGQLIAEVQANGRPGWRAEAEFSDAGDLAAALASLASTEGAPVGGRVILQVVAPLVQLRRVRELPPVGPRHLAALVDGRPGKFFRKNGAPLVTGAVWASRGRTEAILAALEVPLADALLEGAERGGFRVIDITPAEPGFAGLSLLPADERTRRRRAIGALLGRGAIAAGFAWVLLAATWGIRAFREARAIDEELGSLRVPVAAALAAQTEIDQARAAIAAVDLPLGTRLAPVIALQELTSALPDSAWLTGLTLRADGRGVATAMAPSTPLLLARWERVRTLPRPTLEGRATAEQVGPRRLERSTVRFGERRGE